MIPRVLVTLLPVKASSIPLLQREGRPDVERLVARQRLKVLDIGKPVGDERAGRVEGEATDRRIDGVARRHTNLEIRIADDLIPRDARSARHIFAVLIVARG